MRVTLRQGQFRHRPRQSGCPDSSDRSTPDPGGLRLVVAHGRRARRARLLV